MNLEQKLEQIFSFEKPWIRYPVYVFIPVFIAFSLYIALFSFLVALASWSDSLEKKLTLSEISYEYAGWLPDISSYSARVNREYAIQLKKSSEDDKAMKYFEIAETRFEEAIKDRPLWPYYYLGVFDVQVRMGKDAEIISKSFDRVRSVAPNERGIDKGLLPMGLVAWSKLSSEQRNWLIKRIETANSYSIGRAIKLADEINLKPILCINFTWDIASKYCYGKRNKTDLKLDQTDLDFLD